MENYFNKVITLLNKVHELEQENLGKAVVMITEAILQGRSIFIFGASHAGILAEEVYYRAGGLVLFNPIFGNEIMLDVEPITRTSEMERLLGYGEVLARKSQIKSDDVIIIHSVSGRNPVAIDMAMALISRNVKIIGITNLAYSLHTNSRHPSGKRLYELCDVVLDNHGDIGDATCSIPGVEQKVGPTSTIVGSAMLHYIEVEVTRNLLNAGITEVPVFYSANLDNGDSKNKEIVEKYKSQIHYRY